MSASLDQMLSQLGQLGTTIPQAYIQGKQLKGQEEDRQLARERLLRQMEMEEELFPLKKRKAGRELTQTPEVEYSIKQDADGNLVYMPKNPGSGPIIDTGTKGIKSPEAEAVQAKADREDYQYYVDQARTNAKTFQAASRVLPALKDSISKGQNATGLASKYQNMAYSILRTLGADPKKTIDLLNMDPTNKGLIDSGIAEMAIGELAAFKGSTTDFEYMKAADIVGPSATADEILLAVLQARMEPVVQKQKYFQKVREKYGDNYRKIVDSMMDYELENPLASYESAAEQEYTTPSTYLTPEEAWEKSKNIASTLGSGAKQLFKEMYNALAPEQRLGKTVLRDNVEDKTYIFQDGVLIGVE